MEIVALQEYTDKYVSLYEGQIRNISDALAEDLISRNIVAQHGDSEGENSMVITYYYYPSYQDIFMPDKQTYLTWDNRHILLNDFKTKKVLFQFVTNNFVSTGEISEIISITNTPSLFAGSGVRYTNDQFKLEELFKLTLPVII